MSSPLYFRHLEIRRMYDRQLDTPPISDLSPRVNVVYGPNAAGKTTLARALKLILWPDDDGYGHVDLSGRFDLDGDPWDVESEGRRTLYRVAGREAARPPLPDLPPSCYLLTLEELLRETGTDEFAIRIRLQAGGGYDVRKAAEALGFRPKPPGSGGKTSAVKNAREKRKAVEIAQRSLQDRQRNLSDLERQLEEARIARNRIHLLDLAIEYHKAREKAQAARLQKEAFPAVLDRLQGNELARLEELRRDRDAAVEALSEAEASIDRAKLLIEQNILPEEGLEDGLLKSLKERLQCLKNAETERDSLEESVSASKKRRDDAWEKINGAVDPSLAAKLTPDHLRILRDLAEKSDRVQGKKAAFEELHSLVGANDADALNKERDRLLLARQALIQWLQAPDPSVSRSLKTAAILLGISLVVLAAVGVWLALAGNLVGYAALGVAILIAIAAAFRVMKQAKNDGDAIRAHSRKSFESTHLAGHANWDAASVAERLDQVLEEAAKVGLGLEKAALWTSKKAEREDLERQRFDLERDRERLLEATGLQPDFTTVQLWYLVEHLLAWQRADAEVKALETRLDVILRRIGETLQDLNWDFVRFGLAEAKDAAGAAGHIDTLTNADRDLKDARNRLESSVRERERAEARLKEIQGRIERLFEELDLAPEDDQALQDLLSQFEEYNRAKDTVRETGAVFQEAETRLKEMHGFTEELLQRDLTSLENELYEQTKVADGYDDLNRQIAEIRAEVKMAEDGNDLLLADAELAQVVEALRQEREKSCLAVAGHVLAEYVYEQTRDLDLPEVFHRARELFYAFTKHRYRLEMNGEGFYAFDRERNCDLALDQLSSSTRIQLLLAVRVAFLELQERGYRLPLLLDETLANSDDQRAEEIIHTILQLGNERQVFYFTAQQDEVAKWQSLDTRGQCCFVNLKQPAESRFRGKDELTGLVTAPPSPNGDSHDEYGRRISVPPWSPHSSPGSLHLWYVIDDVTLLVRLLTIGYQTWGPLLAALEAGEAARLGIDDRHSERLRIIGHALDTYCEAWKIGRGKPVDRYVLLQSNAVSDRFIDEVADLCKKCNGDAAELIVRLEAREVQGFGSKKIENLRDYFEENGFIPSAEMLSPDEILERVYRTVAPDLPAGMTLEDVLRVIRRLDPHLPPR